METRKARKGIPLSDEELHEWENAFILIAECIKALYNKNQGG